MEPLVTALVKKGASQLATCLAAMLQADGRRFEELRREIWEEIGAETAAAVSRLEAKHGELAAEVAAKMGEREAVVLVGRLLEEAARSATRERLRLLCAAAAGVFTPELDVEMKSRVSRAILQLEPSDVRALRKMRTAPHAFAVRLRSSSSSSRGGVSFNSLEAAGCIRSVTITGETKTIDVSARDELPIKRLVTKVGSALLAFVETWQEGDPLPGDV